MRIGKNKMASVAAALILALPAAKGEDTMKAKEFEIKGPWQVAVDGVVFQVPPPATIEVTGERHDRLPLFQNAGGWNDGVPLKGVWAVGCSLADALDPASVAAALSDGTALERGKDYQFNDKWGTIGRVEGGRVGEETPVTVRYRYIPMRLDSLAEGGDGSWRYVVGEPASWCPLPPELCPGETRRANLYVDSFTRSLAPENIYPVTETAYPAECAAGMRRFLPATMSKLTSGGKLRILAWGDSVTEGSYLDDREERWQEQFVGRLRAAYPAAEIELVTNGWGGRTISNFLDEPSGSPYNYEETVLAVRPDLVISEFVNDAGLPPEAWEHNFPKVLADFRARGYEWIILTPHYVRPDWMGLTTQNGPGIEEDPRPYVHYIRKFAAANDVALADAARRYGRVWRQGIPYNTLMTNCINHPDRRGMAIFADALMAIFE